MPVGDKYIALRRYLENCGQNEITMTFEQIDDIVGGMPKSAYDYTAPWYDSHGGPLAQNWLNAGYTSSAVVPGKQVTFTKQNTVPKKRAKYNNEQSGAVTSGRIENDSMKNLCVFDDRELLVASMDKTAKEYRLNDPGWYLYRMIINYNGDKITSDFVQLVYVTLCAWNMNSRAAKLSEYDDFEKSIISYGHILKQLAEHDIHSLSASIEIQNQLEELFFNLNLVAAGKPILVTASKTLHFFMPNLIVPIDRKYTLNFFNGNESVPTKIEKQFQVFIKIQREFSLFSATHDLTAYKDERWNLTIPKVMDNMIIGFMKQ